jgi:hypothetical protein
MKRAKLKQVIKLITLIWTFGLASLLQYVWFVSMFSPNDKSWVAINNFGEMWPELFITAFFWGLSICGVLIYLIELWDE